MTTPATTFQSDAGAFTARGETRDFMRTALHGYEQTRAKTTRAYRDYKRAREAAMAIKWEALEGLDTYLAAFADKIASRGAKIFWASDATEARDYIVGVCREKQAKLIVKSKCMTSEEIHLNEALEKNGYETVETDLGEYIVQLRNEAPFHFVFPAMHLKRGEISRVFEEKLSTAPSDSPEELTMIARRVLRKKYLQADIGISGANFAIAETGQISITENEGNARLTTTFPRVHIALLGIEKILPRQSDLALFLPLLASAGTGQAMTCYNSLFSGPRKAGEVDGPEELHIVLLDNHRTRLLADATARDALRCIRCGACLNVCPIFKNIGGHSYGTTYQGPIGAVITPHLRGLKDWRHLSSASSLCGACTETCPVGIDLHHHLLRNRSIAPASAGEKMAWRGFASLMRNPSLYEFGSRFASSALGFAKPWSESRGAPPKPEQTFRQWWKSR
jgi:L-lactate dehydrogenase complex protein LldF